MAVGARLALVVFGVAAASLGLQGCGPSTTTTTTTPTTTTALTTSTTSSSTSSSTSVTSTTSTTTTYHKRTPGKSADEMAKFLNEQYYGFDETDPSSPLGVTLSMAAASNSFYKNIFCSSFDNPLGKTGCWEGTTDCRLSASIVNHKMLLSKTSHTPVFGLGRTVGIILDTTLVESELARCSYMFDGASQRRWNVGCGMGSGGNCDSEFSAYNDICPSTKETCTAKDWEVTNALCEGYGGKNKMPPTHAGYFQCVIPGAAMDYRPEGNWTPSSTTGLRYMLNSRVERNDGHDAEGPNLEKWNEVVIDERLMMPKIWWDPSLVIPAIVYKKSSDNTWRRQAEQLRDEFCKYNILEDKIPVVAFNSDARIDKGEKVFLVEEATESDAEPVVV